MVPVTAFGKTFRFRNYVTRIWNYYGSNWNCKASSVSRIETQNKPVDQTTNSNLKMFQITFMS